MIVGYPGETRADAAETLGFLERNADKLASVRLTRWYLGVSSIMGRDPVRYGIMPFGDRPLSRDPATFRLVQGPRPSQVDDLVKVFRTHPLFGARVTFEDADGAVEDYQFVQMLLSEQDRGGLPEQTPGGAP